MGRRGFVNVNRAKDYSAFEDDIEVIARRTIIAVTTQMDFLH